MKNWKDVVRKIFNTIFTVVLISWVVIVFTDYMNAKNDKPLKFCIKEFNHKYDDGETYECVGLGYKMYKYNRHSITAKEFGPIFIRERQDSTGL
ncbi:MAG: hypothetical protein E7158_01200 [Firmicutes bacterium]|nr:hypothetical protein [Bacillota bacterium]